MSDNSQAIKQAMLERGYELVMMVPDKAALGRSIYPTSRQPGAVFRLDAQGGLYDGFLADYHTANKRFNHIVAEAPEAKSAEQMIYFNQVYTTHRIGFYKNWMIVQPFDGEIFCFAPSDEWDGGLFPDLDYLLDMYQPFGYFSSLEQVLECI
ncbi:hypothetical protein LJC60_09570 [Ruminococcaceae bacterium OttesenSCG-928-D13]|nr:hypothetical protein [Ruminococcaceae bacterium OttesenSCG-928-D13]